MITIVTWKWYDPRYSHRLLPEYYNILFGMLRRNISLPDWWLLVITDDHEGLHPDIHTMPLPVTKATGVHNPFGARFPSCYQRLWLFSEEAKALGERVINIDVDVVITNNIDHLLTRDEDFIGWTDARFKWRKVAGGFFSLRTGTHTHVWDDFDPETSPQVTVKNNQFGSDQGWMTHKLYPPEASYRPEDGLYYAHWLPRRGRILTEKACIVQTPGDLKPWVWNAQRVYPWITQYWRSCDEAGD